MSPPLRRSRIPKLWIVLLLTGVVVAGAGLVVGLKWHAPGPPVKDLLLPAEVLRPEAAGFGMLDDGETFDLPGSSDTVVRRWRDDVAGRIARQEVRRADNESVARITYRNSDPSEGLSEDLAEVNRVSLDAARHADDEKAFCVAHANGGCRIYVLWMRYEIYLIKFVVTDDSDPIEPEPIKRMTAALDRFVQQTIDE